MTKRILLAILLLLLSSNVYAYNWCGDSNCQGCWLMEVDEVNLTDSSQNTNTAAILGAGEPNYATATPPDTYSVGYYTFDGDDDTLEVTKHASIEPANDFTLLCWSRLTDDKSGDWHSFFSKLYDEGGEPYYSYDFRFRGGVNDDLSIQINVEGTRTWSDQVLDDSGLLNVWTHWAVVREAENIRMFIDGGKLGNDSDEGAGAITYYATNLNMGGTSNENLQGDMDECAIFDTALDGTDLDDIIANGLYESGEPEVARRIFSIN